jgi:hypothetical protein
MQQQLLNMNQKEQNKRVGIKTKVLDVSQVPLCVDSDMHAHLVTFRQCFFWQFCFIAEVTNDPHEDLAKFWLQAKYESKNPKKPPSMFVGCLLETMYKNLAILS